MDLTQSPKLEGVIKIFVSITVPYLFPERELLIFLEKEEKKLQIIIQFIFNGSLRQELCVGASEQLSVR